MRLKRHKICVEDFDLLTIIGRGAFGEVLIFIYFICIRNLRMFLIACMVKLCDVFYRVIS